MMCSQKSLLLVAWMSALLLLQLYSQSEAARSYDCCLRYTRGNFSHKHIVRFERQRAGEGCDIDAIIFFTRRKLAVCANPEEIWVKRNVYHLSKRVKKV